MKNKHRQLSFINLLFSATSYTFLLRNICEKMATVLFYSTGSKLWVWAHSAMHGEGKYGPVAHILRSFFFVPVEATVNNEYVKLFWTQSPGSATNRKPRAWFLLHILCLWCYNITITRGHIHLDNNYRAHPNKIDRTSQVLTAYLKNTLVKPTQNE